MGKVLTTLVLLLVALVAAVLIGPSFVDWNQYKTEIAAEAKKATGRDLTVAGDVSLALLPSPALSAEKVSLANVQGGSRPEMLELEALEIQVALLPLLGGRSQVQSVSLVKPRILLEVLPDGRNNWDLENGTPETAAATSDDGGSEAADQSRSDSSSGADEDFTIRVDNFTIEQGSLVYRDAPGGREERIEAIDARIVAESLRGPFAVQGEMTSHSTRGRIDATIGRLPEAGATTFNVTFGLPEAIAEAQLTGTLSRHPESFELRGKLKGQGENLAAVIDTLAKQSDDLPAALGNPFTLEGAIEADDVHFSATELRLGLGTTAIEGAASWQAGPPSDVRLKIAASRLDLDELLAEASQPEDSSEAEQEAEATEGQAESNAVATAAAPAAPKPAQAFALPSDLNGAVDISVGALVLRGQVVRQIRLSAELADGRLALNQAMALLPGGSDVSLAGGLAPSEQGPRFQGRFEGASDNLRAVLQWLGAPVADVPADRLRKMSVTSRIDATPSQVNLSELDLRLDLSRLAGGVVVALRERPGLGIGLALDTLNLDAYLPRGGALPAGSPSGETETASAEESATSEDAETEENEAGGTAGSSSPGGPLEAFDANLNLRVGSLTYQGQTARDITLQGTLQNGDLSIKQASVADLAGSALSYSGGLSGLGDKPAVDGTLDLKIADPTKLAAMAGVDAALLGRIGAFNMTGNVTGSLDEFAFNSKLAMLGGRFGLAGNAKLLSAPLAFDVTLDAEHPDAGRLAQALAGPGGLGPGLGKLDLKARLAGTPAQVTISGLSGRLGPFDLNGGLGLDLGGAQPTPRDVNLALQVKHESLAKLSRALGGPALGSGLGGIDVKGKLSGGAQKLSLSEMSGIAGPFGLSGNLDANLAGDKPSLGAFNLNVRLKHRSLADLASAAGLGTRVDPNLGGVDLGAHVFGDGTRVDMRDLRGSLGPVDLKGTANVVLGGARPLLTADLSTGELPLSRLLGGAGGAGGAGGTGSGSLSPRWSSAPIDLSGLRALDANLKVKSTAIQHQDLRLAKADLAATLNNGVLDIAHLNGTMFGGALQVRGKVESQGVPALGLAITAIEIDSKQLLRRMAKFDRVSGPVSLNANLSSRGRSEAELVSALSGNGDVAGQIVVTAKAEEAVGAALLSVLGQQVEEIGGLANTGTSLFQSFAGTPSRLSGTFRVQQGLVSTDDLRLDGRDAVALTRGSASLPAWQVNSRTDVYRNQNPDAPFLTATVTGPLDKPNTKIGGDVFQRRQQQPAPSGGGNDQPQQPQGIKPEDLLKGLLNNLGQ